MTRTAYGRSVSTHVERGRAVKPSVSLAEVSGDDTYWAKLKRAKTVLDEKSQPITLENLVAEAGLTRSIVQNFFKNYPARRYTLKVVKSKRGPKS